ncbi:MAG: type I DNA topoisomerase [Clostridiales bacterium]|nr:type I DNA topoisomerase [Clostridiales bacterium]
MSNLVIIESPGKVKTIKSCLGKNYDVIASVGHVRDLPKSSLGIDVNKDFEPKYVVIQGKTKVINELKQKANEADRVFLATDPDREGEAISWHLSKVLELDEDKTDRVTFNEITKTAVQKGIESPRKIDMDLVNSQQARRVLDRLVGYKLSPFLWKTIKSGLSAGRVQSVAARIIVEREEEIQAFKPEEYWTIDAVLSTSKRAIVNAKYYGNSVDKKTEIKSKEEAQAILDAIEGGQFVVVGSTKEKKQKAPQPPFTTSTMQQEASRRYGFQTTRTMKIAQQLYEGVGLGKEFGGDHGIITYMRTDSLRIADEAAYAAKEYIENTFGKEYYPSKRRVYKTKNSAQDAHEAIRPSDMNLNPEKLKGVLTSEQYKLYKLIWNRFIASQMKNAELEVLSLDIECNGKFFKASTYDVAFKGFTAVSGIEEEEDEEKREKIPNIDKDEILKLESIAPKQNFTEPPPHFNEGSLVKFLEEKGIGRPSTYATIISTIIERGYVERDKKNLTSTPLGKTVVEVMKENFPEYVDYKFTADAETKLDSIAQGEHTYNEVISKFYDDFNKCLDKANKNAPSKRIKIPVEETDYVCDNCGRKMVIKHGPYGKFLACSGYPECKNTMQLDKNGNIIQKVEKAEPVPTDMICDKCGKPMVLRTGKYGSFYACTDYPKCKTTKPVPDPIGVPCPKCGRDILKVKSKSGRIFFRCEGYPKCDFASWNKPVDEKCPKCGSILVESKKGDSLYCSNPDCDYKKK